VGGGRWLRLPTSSSHALIGGLVGAGLAKGGLEAIKASSVQKAALFIVIPLTQLGSHLLAGAALAVLGLGLAVALWIGLQRTARSRHFEPDQLAAEDSPALVR
jgi:hypothetical protein